MHASKEQLQTLGRLIKRAMFLHVQVHGRKWVSRGLILQACENNGTEKRFGLTVSKKVSKSAVCRNRIRRRLRAVAADILPGHAKTGFDYVLIGRPETERKPYKDLQNDLLWCLKRLELLQDRDAA